jgi:hypothetical protein
LVADPSSTLIQKVHDLLIAGYFSPLAHKKRLIHPLLEMKRRLLANQKEIALSVLAGCHSVDR